MVTLNILPFGCTWGEFAAQQPDLAAQARARLEEFAHHVMATISHDGSPRVSGTEVFWDDGRLLFGAMSGSRKAQDLAKDPRVALHTNPGDGTMVVGDFKFNGRAQRLEGPDLAQLLERIEAPVGSRMYEVRLSVVCRTRVRGDQLDVHVWRPGQELKKAN